MPASGPADTVSYFAAGYIVIFTFMAIYLASLVLRHRNLRQDLDTYKEIEDKEKK